MNRATVVYILIVGFCVAGLWVILRIGHGLRAPPDLSGVWEIDAAGPSESALGKTMTIDQSGRFVEIRFDGGQVLDLKVADGDAQRAAPAAPHAATLAGNGWTFTATLDRGPAGRTMAAYLKGRESHAFTARLRNGHAPGKAEARH